MASSPQRLSSSVPLIYDLCTPRGDVLKGATDSDFAADLAKVVRGVASAEYQEPRNFFANTYPTRGLQNLLANVCARLSGTGGEAAAIFRLDTSYGGGKTHGLIALVHAAAGMKDVANVSEFIDPALVPSKNVRVAAFDGENADPANGRSMGNGIFARTPWGEIAFALAGPAGYERVRRSDELMVSPGADTIAELFGGEPTLILLDELSVYLRKTRGLAGAPDQQLTAFLTSLFKAVESSPCAALVYTLAIGKDGQPVDAYSSENQFIADRMAEAESVSARKATLLNPTEDDETIKVLQRRLFEKIDAERAGQVIDTYRRLWTDNQESLDPEAVKSETIEAFRLSYPLHPEVLDVLTSKLATLNNFQRVRGMLRILTRTIANVWAVKSVDATAIHLHHLDPGYAPIYNEIVTRLAQSGFVPAIRSDITATAPARALAQEIDDANYRGLSPYATFVARTIFMNSLAFNEPLKGVAPERLRYSILGPATDIGFIEDARKRFISMSAYLDDRPTAPMRFLTEANLTQIIRRQEQRVDKEQARTELNDSIKQTFSAGRFQTIPFPSGPYEVPDEIGDGRPLLALMSYDGLTVGGSVDAVPDLIARIFDRKGSAGTDFRIFRNNVVFLVADEVRKDDMRAKMIRRLALIEMKNPERMKDLAEHQQAKVREWESKSLTDLAIAIQQTYRHVFYPSSARIAASGVELAHTALDVATSDRPGDGQRAVTRALGDLKKLRLPEDEPDSPTFTRDRTPLRKGEMSAAALRDEFRRDPALPILIENDVFLKGIRKGVELGEYVYQRGDLLYGKGDPAAMIIVDEQSQIFTMAFATEKRIWPRPVPQVPGAPSTEPSNVGGGQPGLFGQPGSGPATSGRPQVGEPPVVPSVGPGQQQFTAQGILKEALTRLWEQARSAKAEKIGALIIKIYDASDAFRLLGVVGSVSNATRSVDFNGGYVTAAGGELQLEFRGPVDDAKPVKEFLDAQLRAAKDQRLEAQYELRFNEGLEMAGDAAEKLTEKLIRYASGAAYVSATAEVQQ